MDPVSATDNVATTGEAEQQLFALVNRDRQAAGLPALAWDERVAMVSRGHSKDMHENKFVGHVSPTTGAAENRVRAASIKTGVVLENIARAHDVGEAHAGLMNSPSHRSAILSSSATHIGIGVVFGGGEDESRVLFVTQVFIRVPPKLDPAQAAEEVRQRIAQVRPVGTDGKLQAIAQEFAAGLAAGKSRESLWPAASKKLDGMSAAYVRVGSVINAASELDAIDGKSLVGSFKPDTVGVGIAQGTHPEIGEGAIWIVVLLAEKQPPKKK
jgi:hypothetical protein